MVYDRRFTALPMVGMVPGDAIEIVATRLSVFARGDLESNSHTIWAHAWCWRCLICKHDWFMKLFQLSICVSIRCQGDLNQFRPLGEGLVRFTMKVVYRPILVRGITQEKKTVIHTAAPAGV